MNALTHQARAWAASTAAHAKATTQAPIETPSRAACKCPACGLAYFTEVSIFHPKQASGPVWLYCSEKCQFGSHPSLKKPAQQIKLATEAERKAQAAIARAQAWLTCATVDGYGFPARYQRFDLAQLSPSAREVARTSLAWTPTIGGKGIGFMGRSEAGKSFIAAELARRLWMAGHDVSVCSMPALISALKGNAELRDRSAMVERCKSAQIVLFDDLGMEEHTSNSLSALYAILQHREEHELANIYTCNLGGAGLQEKFAASPALYNRLKRTAEWVAI